MTFPLEAKALLAHAEFMPIRMEHLGRVPLARLLDLSADAHHELVPVTCLDPADVAALDNEVRGDIPGSEEWRGTAADLLDPLDDPESDPELYLVARSLDTETLDGLIRVWNRSPSPRLGCIGVVRGWRRTRLAGSMVRSVARVLHERGVGSIIAETDDGNRDSEAMARRAGGEVTGATRDPAPQPHHHASRSRSHGWCVEARPRMPSAVTTMPTTHSTTAKTRSSTRRRGAKNEETAARIRSCAPTCAATVTVTSGAW